MVYKPFVQEEEKNTYRPFVQEIEPEHMTWDYSAVTSEDIMDMTKKNIVRNAPEIVGVTSFVTGAVVAGGGTLLSKMPIQSVAAGKAVGLFVASKLTPLLLTAKEYYRAYSKASNPRLFNLENGDVQNVVDNMDEFDKGLVESVSLGTAIARPSESLARDAGKIAGGIARDFILVAGMPIPAQGKLIKKFGADAVNISMFNAAMTVNSGIEEYNISRNTGSSQDDAISLAMARLVGEGAGTTFGFLLLPRMTVSLSKRFLGKGVSGLNPVVGGVSFAGYDTVTKIAANQVVNSIENTQGKEITDKYEISAGDFISSAGVGTLFSGTLWGAGKLLNALGRQAVNAYGKAMTPNQNKALADEIKKVDVSKPIEAPSVKNTEREMSLLESIRYDQKNRDRNYLFENMSRSVSNKSLADRMVETAKKQNYVTTLNGIEQPINEINFTKDMMNEKINSMRNMIEAGATKEEALNAVVYSMPGEYINRKNILGLLEFFENVH